jgi:tight adherence protein C
MIFFILSFFINFIFFSFLKFNFKSKKRPFTQKENKLVSNLHAGADFIDSLLLYLESGCNTYDAFDQAVRGCMNSQIKKHGIRALLNYSLGNSLIEALKHSADPKNYPIYSEIVDNIALSIQLGTPLKTNLCALCFQFRTRANLELEEIAAKAPIKMIFPLVFFIFPVIFILLGSGFIQDLFKIFEK